MTAVRSAPLEIEFDRSISGGIKFMKDRMRESANTIITKNEISDQQEQHTKELKEAYRRAVIRQNKMRRKIYEDEEKLEIVDRNIKELERRLYEKQEFLRELSTFKTGDSIEEAARMDVKLAEKKRLYAENYDKFQKGRQRKIELEQKHDLLECRARAVHSKIKALTCEVHHLKLGHERKTQESQKSAENAMFSSSEYEKLEKDMDVMRARMLGASQRVNSLTMQIQNKETEIRSMQFNRLDMETTIKNILRKVQEQIAKNQQRE